MATFTRLIERREEIVDEVYRRLNNAEANRDKEFEAALRIQSWFRATRVRVYIAHLNASARLIQRRWRGYTGRKRYRDILKHKVFDMKLNHYNDMATLVQKVWRGYYTRKYISNYYSRKRYLEGLKVKNEIIRNELEEFAEQQEQRNLKMREELDRKRLEHWSSKYHHLVSTAVMPGIFNSPFQPYPDELEYYLRNAKPLKHKLQKESTPFDPTCKRYDLPVPDPLPPIQQKPQGPFRDPRDVQKQRYKPFQPSLKVATAFTSVEEARKKMKQAEWVTRLNDDIFQPFTKKAYSYNHLLHTTSKYGHLPYGTKYFRHEFPENFTSTQSFQTVVPPIPVFERLNDTFSQGQV